MDINIGKKIGEYLVEKSLGTGGFGNVYQVSKEDAGGKYLYALKHITFPSTEMYNEISLSMHKNKTDIDAFFNNMLQDIVAEFNTMRDLSAKNSKYFVTYYDHQIFGDPKKYDVFIRMELLTPFNSYCNKKTITVSDIIKLGIEIGEALSICHRKKIMHRDVKEANIFVNADGDFKLGDFGVSKTLDKTTQLMSRKGTPFYMAPEVLLNQDCDFNADIYALAMVLYKQLNKSRYPFMPPYPEAFTNQDVEKAQTIKLKGMKPSLPCLAENELGGIIVKALASKTERHQTADEFIAALKKVKTSLSKEFLNTVISEASALNDNNTALQTSDTEGATIGSNKTAADTTYGENQNIFSFLNKTDTEKSASIFNTVERQQLHNQGMTVKKAKLDPVKLMCFMISMVFGILFVLYINVIVFDLFISNISFFDSIIFRIFLVIIFGTGTVFFVIYALIYPDNKTILLSKESKKWRIEALAILNEIDGFVAKKTAHDSQNKNYKNLKGELAELKRRVRESKSFWKVTSSSRQCETEAIEKLKKLNDVITKKDYLVSVGNSKDFKTMSDAKKSEFSMAANNIKRLIEQREAKLQNRQGGEN